MSQAIGGQAVLEGVMMRGPRNWAVAVRTPDGDIAHVARTDRSADGAPLGAAPADRPRRDRARRVLAIGFRALSVSAQYAAAEEEAGEGEPAEIGRWALFAAFAVAIGFAIAIFKVGPALITDTLPISNGSLFVLVEGLVRVTVFVLYLGLLSFIPYLRRVLSTTRPSTRRSTPTRPARS